MASVCVPLFENLEKKDTKLDFLASGFRAMFFSAKQFFSDKRKKNVFWPWFGRTTILAPDFGLV